MCVGVHTHACACRYVTTMNDKINYNFERARRGYMGYLGEMRGMEEII